MAMILGLRACFLAFLLAGCLTPPAVPGAGWSELDLAAFPKGTELVEIGGKERLRGVYRPGSPLILLFCEARGSITLGAERYPLLWDLRARGAGYLCVDYRGVGASDGEGSPKHIAADARAAWDEALRRAGGDPSRIVLRGISLGGFAIGALLDAGVEPGGVVLAAPVRAETVVGRFADRFGKGLERGLARLLYRRPVRTDVVAAIAGTRAPTLVACGAQDPYLDDGERALFARAAGTYVEWPESDHYDAADSGRSLFSAERVWLDRFGPGSSDLDERVEAAARLPGAPPVEMVRACCERLVFDVPSTAAAVATVYAPDDLTNADPLVAFFRTIPALPVEPAVELVSIAYATDFQGWRAWVESAPDDPAALLARIRETRRHARVETWTPMHGLDQSEGIAYWGQTFGDRDKEPVDETSPIVARLRLPEPEMLRQGFLLALKAKRIPARAVEGGVQVWQDGWRFVPVDG